MGDGAVVTPEDPMYELRKTEKLSLFLTQSMPSDSDRSGVFLC